MHFIPIVQYLIQDSERKGFKNDLSYESAVKILRGRISQIKLPNTEPNVLSMQENSPQEITENVANDSIWTDYDLDFNRTVRPENSTAAGIREFDKYLSEEYLDRKKDPLKWWKERKHLYPRVYSYVLKRLCIVATSVPCERIFSATGQIINERRTLYICIYVYI